METTVKCVLSGFLNRRTTAGALGSSPAIWRYSVKIGDLVKRLLTTTPEAAAQLGTIVSGPRVDWCGDYSVTSYEVSWTLGRNTWHSPDQLEVVNEDW